MSEVPLRRLKLVQRYPVPDEDRDQDRAKQLARDAPPGSLSGMAQDRNGPLMPSEGGPGSHWNHPTIIQRLPDLESRSVGGVNPNHRVSESSIQSVEVVLD